MIGGSGSPIDCDVQPASSFNAPSTNVALNAETVVKVVAKSQRVPARSSQVASPLWSRDPTVVRPTAITDAASSTSTDPFCAVAATTSRSPIVKTTGEVTNVLPISV